MNFWLGVSRKAADYGHPRSEAIFYEGHFCIAQNSRWATSLPLRAKEPCHPPSHYAGGHVACKWQV